MCSVRWCPPMLSKKPKSTVRNAFQSFPVPYSVIEKVVKDLFGEEDEAQEIEAVS